MSRTNVRRAIVILIIVLTVVLGALMSNAYFASTRMDSWTVYLSLIAAVSVIIVMAPLWWVLFPEERK